MRDGCDRDGYCRLDSTATTPLVLSATWIAFSASRGLATPPLIRTTPWSVVTLMRVAGTPLVTAYSLLILVVIQPSPTVSVVRCTVRSVTSTTPWPTSLSAYLPAVVERSTPDLTAS